MTLPGFSAELSLAKSTTDYQVPHAPLASSLGKEVVPQFCLTEGNMVCCWVQYSGWACHHLIRTHA
jgi:hypothetical protein